jgi:hypothetical protein
MTNQFPPPIPQSPIPERVPAAQRLPFFEEVMGRCQTFAQQLLVDVPELEGIAILPSYIVPQYALSYGLVAGKHGPLRNPQELQNMAIQVHGCLKQLLDNHLQVLKIIDEKAGELAKTVSAKQKELHALEQRIAAHPNHGESQPPVG